MALITGSSAIDWSGVVLDSIDVEQNLDEFSSRFDEVVTEFDDGHYFFNSSPTSTVLSFTLNSGGVVAIRGSEFGTGHAVVKSFRV